MNSRAQRQAEQLGMSFSTARSKLVKQLLFRMLVQHNENICFRCSETISNIEDLSIEHKLPWEGRDVNLFWDLDNVTFSHLKCNRPHELKLKIGNADWVRDNQKKVGPLGTSWCSGHKEFEPIENFGKNSSRHDGLQCYCKGYNN